MALVSKLTALFALSLGVPAACNAQETLCLKDNSCSATLKLSADDDGSVQLLQRKLEKPNDLKGEVKIAAKIDSSGVSFMHDSSFSPEQLGHSGEAQIDASGDTKTAPVPQTNASSALCGEHPTLCKQPLDCSEPPSEEEIKSWHTTIVKEDGQPNLRLWCHSDFTVLADSLVQECLVNKDPVKGALAVFELQKTRAATEADASYCFWEKFCSNQDVTPKTSLLEARNACDSKYGRESWTSVNMKEMAVLLSTFPNAENESFSGPELPSAFGRLSCAMGNFHCDAVYCQQTYCKMPQYIEKYGHLLNRTV